jgi:hypothetical protein
MLGQSVIRVITLHRLMTINRMIIYEQITSLQPSITLRKHRFPQEDGAYYWMRDEVSEGWRLVKREQMLYMGHDDESTVRSWSIGELGEYLPPRLAM